MSKTKILTAIPLMTLLALLLISCSANKEPNKDKRLHVSTMELVKSNISSSIEISSKIQAASDITTPFRLADYVQKVNFAEGDRVQKGDIVIELQSKAQQSALEQAKISLDNAKRDHDRAQRLRRSGTYSDAQLEQSSSKLKAAEAQYETAKAMESYSRLPSPITGTINRIPLKEGDFASVGSVAFQVVDMSHLEAEIWVPERNINLIEMNSEASITRSNDPNAMPYKGVISSISLTSDPATNTYRVLVKIQPKPTLLIYDTSNNKELQASMLRPGNIVTVSLTTHTYNNIYAIPLSAVVPKGDTRFIYLTKDGDLKKIVPSLLGTVGDIAVIDNNIDDGYRLIIQGQRFIAETTKVLDVTTQRDAKPDNKGKGSENSTNKGKKKSSGNTTEDDAMKTKGS